MNKKTGLIHAVAGVALVLAAHAAEAAQLVIAQVAPLSGLEAIQGRAYSAGLQLAFTNANKAGGAGGHTFTLVRKDDGGRPEDTLSATTQVLADSKPIALAGYFGNRSIAELVKSGILEKEKIALVGYRTTEIRPDVPNLYSVRAGLRDEINKIAEHLVTVGITRLGLFHEDGPGAAALTAAVDEIAKRTGATITARATYPAGTARVSPAIETFLKTPPQAIIMLATGSAAAGFIEQYRLAGGAAQLFAQSGADIEQLAQRLGEETMQGIAIAQVTPSPYKISGRLAKEFADTVAKTPNLEVPPSYAMMEGYIAGKVIVEAVRRMGAKASREGFVAALEGIDSYDLGGYRVGFKPGTRSGSKFVELSIVTGAGKIRQ
jgi:ABC-type branched-subunit amino acid transport system substrate-binding protein